MENKELRPIAVIECCEEIPCNPCMSACPHHAIVIEGGIHHSPQLKPELCVGCGICVARCSGQAIFLVDEDTGDGKAEVTIPYELLPIPETGDMGSALDRSGTKVCEAEVVSVKYSPAFDKTHLLTMRVPKEYAMRARFFAR